ncbi:MAG: peptidylprolyl isomerase [Pseudomonadota bacterium]
MTSHIALSALIAASLALSSPLLAQETTTEPEAEAPAEADAAPAVEVTADTVVARIGEKEFTMAHVLVVRRGLPEQYANLPDEVLFEGIVDQLVDQYLLSQEVTEIPPSVELRLENDRAAMLASTVINDMLEQGFSDEELQAAYDEAFGDQEPETEYSAAHILVETEEEAQAIVEELEGGADFAELAMERSTGPSGPRGGDLGWFGAGAMVPAFDAAVQEMEPETISAPVQTDFGWHVIRLNEVREKALPTLEEVSPQLTNELSQQAVADKITGLRESSGAEILIDSLPATALRDDSILPE